jgi:PknH-like extracellular domain
VKRLTVGLLALTLALAGCSGHNSESSSPPTPKPVTDSALDGLLLGPDQIDAIMSTTGMTPHKRVTATTDHRSLLPNLNCLGIWQVDEAAIYGADDWNALRQELLRSPDTDNWNDLAVQSVISYPTAEAARDFFAQSSDRWSKCTNHKVNVTVNDQQLPKWTSGDLTKSDTELAIPFTRVSADRTESCQRALAVAANVILDIQACKNQPTTVTQAADIAAAIESGMPR